MHCEAWERGWLDLPFFFWFNNVASLLTLLHKVIFTPGDISSVIHHLSCCYMFNCVWVPLLGTFKLSRYWH